MSKLSEATNHIDIKVDMDEMDVTGAEKKATYQQIKDYVLDKFGLKVSSLNIAQIKDKCGIKERENYNIAKCESGVNKRCTPYLSQSNFLTKALEKGTDANEK